LDSVEPSYVDCLCLRHWLVLRQSWALGDKARSFYVVRWIPCARRPQFAATQQASSVMMVQLTKSLDSRKLTAGNSIEAKVGSELRWNGTVRGSKVMGHVTESSSKAKGAPGLLWLFLTASLKDGTDRR
jgi:hypothetical protein